MNEYIFTVLVCIQTLACYIVACGIEKSNSKSIFVQLSLSLLFICTRQNIMAHKNVDLMKGRQRADSYGRI